ncbi:hypothetical protein BGZ68_001515 [Mortierella alpina]|nr:hypothetical protein BGZ68_001515 [Mortierella alpina]
MYSPSRPTSTSPSTPSSASQRPSAAHGHSQQQQHSHPRSRSHSQSYPHPQGQSNSTSSMPEALRQAPPPPMLHPLERHAPQQPTVQQQQITTPFLNSINRVSRTYYSKQEQAIIYQARNPAVHVQRQSDMRRESCEVIAAIGKRIGFPQHTISTAQLLLHRFYMFHSVPDSGNEVVMACLFVSSKVEDTIKKLKDIMLATYFYRHPGATDWDSESKEGEEQRKRILSYEKMVLESICFDFRIIHPYNYVVQFVKIMQGSKRLAREAWDIVRDSYKIGACLEYPPHTIAAGSIYLASKLICEPFPDLIRGEPWMKAFRTRSNDVEDFSHQMLDLFSIGRTDDQRQLYDKIHITLHDARQLDTEHQQPKLKKARMDYSRPMGVQAELKRIQDGGASNPTVRYSQS